ncbi:MAG: hypothetical protein AAF882_08435 [Pseudomonadota bacterium]
MPVGTIRRSIKSLAIWAFMPTSRGSAPLITIWINLASALPVSGTSIRIKYAATPRIGL